MNGRKLSFLLQLTIVSLVGSGINEWKSHIDEDPRPEKSWLGDMIANPSGYLRESKEKRREGSDRTKG